MFRSIFRGKGEGIPASKLPQLHSFLDVIAGGRPAKSVSVEAITSKTIVTRDALGKPGEMAVLIYTAPAGKFRAEAKIVAVTATNTQFDVPKRVSLIGASGEAQKRQSVRLDAIVSGDWRYAPGGVGTGQFMRCTVRDISRGGCSLIIDRPLKLRTSVEVRMKLHGEGEGLVLLGEVMRHEEIKVSGKQSHGLRFHGLRPDEDQAIIDFINRRQADLRSRGLA